MTDTLDPLGTSELITSTYRRYLGSLLPIQDEAIAAALDQQIATSRQLAKGPYLEATPPYETGATLRDLISEDVLDPGMAELGGPALPLDRPLYRHQDEAIRKATAGQNLVVATGTGSGKTESFLLPILNSLAAERTAGTLVPGVRALLLYPMNALANDQMKRLRMLLTNIPWITFGRYTGDTKESPRDARELFEALNPGEPLLPNELLSREEMRAAPPHLLLTNYAMLEYLLLRPADMELFEGVHGGAWKFLAVDEAHVYDGAKAAELAMLLRRLHDRVAPDKRLQCLATSATIGDDPSAATRFAAQLFAAPFEWVDDDPARQDLVGPTRRPAPEGPFWGPLSAADYRKLAELPDPAAEIARLAAQHGAAAPRGQGATASQGHGAAAPQGPGDAHWLLSRERRMADLRAGLAAGPQGFSEVARQVFDPGEDPDRSLAALVAVGARVRDETGTAALSARYHLFTRATEGAFTCLTERGPHVTLGRHQACEQCSGAAFEVGACQRCGAVYLTGSIEADGDKPILVPQKREGRPYWLLLGEGADGGDEDEETLDEAEGTEGTESSALCTGCGALHVGGASSCCEGAVLRPVQYVATKGRDLKACANCGARGSSVRRFESGQDAAVAVVSTALYQALPADSDGKLAAKPGGGRKLLLFSDSRQRAAFFAPYLGTSYGALQHRRLIWEGLRAAAADDEVHVENLVDGVTRAATAAGVFHSMTRPLKSAKDKVTALWVMQELVALDDRNSLEGRGLLRVTLARDPGWQVPAGLADLGLTDGEAWDLLSELMRTLRQQGALTMPENVAADDDAFAPRVGPIYVRDDGSDRKAKVLSWLPSAGRNRRLDYVERLLRSLGAGASASTGGGGSGSAGAATSARQVLKDCWASLKGLDCLAMRTPAGLGVVRQVSHEWLDLEIGASLYRCTTCRRVAPVSVRGVCTTIGCQGTLEGWTVPDEAADTDHYRSLYRTMDPIPLTVSEHTAQWTGTEAAKIQQDFLRGDVNALSCSTTFELGVDVGELQSVIMRNMPPNTANYVQRAGRAGRRTDSAALVVTYAQRASHDLSRFQDPVEMIAGRMRAPYVPLANERIDRRHAHSIALAAFFRHGKQVLGQEWKTAGQFFLPDPDNPAKPVPATLVESFLTPVPPRVAQSLSSVLPPSVQQEIGVADGAWVGVLAELLESVRGRLAEEVELLAERQEWAYEAKKGGLGDFFGRIAETIRKRDLLGFLASRNVLPKYGFPVDTVDLMTGHTKDDQEGKLALSRDLTSAIYEYAPGGEIVAGGRLWTSTGIYKRPGRELDGKQFVLCSRCNGIQVTNAELAGTCPRCDAPYANTDKHGRYVVPEFGFLAARETKSPGMTPPQRSWDGDTYVVDMAAEPEEHLWRTADGGVITARAGARGRLLALSEGIGGKGFWVCPRCGWGKAVAQGKPKKSHPDPLRGTDCTTTLRQYYLAHEYETDLLELSFEPTVLSETGWSTLRSLLAAILEGAAGRLQIARDDIGGTIHPGPGGRTSLVVYDTVPAGAGNAIRIGRALDQVVAGALDLVADCDCGAETSCYGCLRNYRNQVFHDVLRRDHAIAALERIGAVAHAADGPGAADSPAAATLTRLEPGTILLDAYTGQTTAMVIKDGRVLMHGETYADAQQAANAADHDVNALDFWSVDLPDGPCRLRDLVATGQEAG